MHIDPRTPQIQPVTATPPRPGLARSEQATSRPVEPAAAAGATSDRPLREARPRDADRNRAPGDETRLDESERRQLEQLKARDREVRAHEAAHKAAAGSLARGGASFDYQTGPDGRRYAVGGEVSIDTAPVPGDPRATIERAQIIRRAANAPAQPSSQDRQVAAAATRMEAEARQELLQGEAAGPAAATATAPATGATDATSQDTPAATAGQPPAAATTLAPANATRPVGELLDVFA